MLTLTILTSSVFVDNCTARSFEVRCLKPTVNCIIPAMSNLCKITSCFKATITEGPATAVMSETIHVPPYPQAELSVDILPVPKG
jgi:hypothetical protein